MPSKNPKPTPGWPEGKAPATLHEFYRCLEVSRALSAEEARRFVDNLPEGKQPQTPKAAAIELIKAGKLTRYQAEAVLRGKIKYLSFGDYTVLERLGRGGMGEVLKAEHRRMQRMVALKVISTAAMKDADAVRRFQREVHAAARLIHPNIVTAFDANEHEGVHFLVMEYVDGKDLAAVVHDQGPLSVATAIDYVLQAARGLAYAHGKGIVHRDIKPGNLLVDREGTVKILDMGLARIDLGPGSSTELTSAGQVMGTVDYMAPEQAEDTHAADARADIYSLGCTLYRLLSGDVLYGGETVVKKLLAHRGAPIPPLAAACPAAPAALDGVFRKMVAKRPEDRQQSMAQVVTELEHVLRGLSSIEPTRGSTEVTTDLKLTEFFAAIGPRSGKSSPTATAQKSATKGTAATEVTQDFAAGDTTTTGLMGLGSVALAKPGAGSQEAGGKKVVGRRPLRGLFTPYVVAIAAALGGLALAAAGIVVFLPTSDGTIRVEINDPSIEVTVSDSGYKIKGQTEEIRIKPGEHTLHVKTGELEFDTSKFILGKGENPPVKVELLPGRVRVVAANGKLLGAKARQKAEAAAAPVRSRGATNASASSSFALEFDGMRSWGHLPVPFEGPGDITLEAWACVYRFINYGTLIGDRDMRIRLGSLPDNRAPSFAGIFSFRDEQKREGNLSKMNWTVVRPHQPVHIALVRREGIIETYVNGKKESYRAGWGEYPNYDSMWDVRFPIQVDDWKLGGFRGNSFAGSIDEIRISRVARYAEDFVPALQFETDAQTLALYHCDEGRGTALNDSSGNGHHGNLEHIEWIPVRDNHAPAYAAGQSPTTAGLPMSPSGWLDLFNGLDIAAWTAKGHEGWSVNLGVLNGESPDKPGWLMTKAEFADFELELEYRLPSDGNSGIFLRVPEDGPVTGSAFNEIQLLDDTSPKFANVDAKAKNGALFGQIAPTRSPATAANQWRQAAIRARGQNVEVTLDGVQVLDEQLRPGTAARGHIGLQLYNPGIAFRNIRVREVSAASSSAAGSMKPNYALEFNGKDSHVDLTTLRYDGSHPITLEARLVLHQVEEGGHVFGGGTLPAGIGLTFPAPGDSRNASHGIFSHRRPRGPFLLATRERLVPDRWMRVAAVLDEKSAWLFLDGKLQARGNFEREGAYVPSDHFLMIGGSQWKPSWFDGLIDEVRISKIARYNSDYTPVDRFEPDKDTLALYHFDEGQGDVLADSSGNGHHGKIVGANWAPAGNASATAKSSADAAQRTIDLLALVDLKRDAVSGQWRMAPDGLIAEATGTPGEERAKRLQLPYTPPEEYDFEVEISPAAPNFRTTQHFWAGGRSITWEYDSKPAGQIQFISGFSRLDNLQAQQSPESLKRDTSLLTPGQRNRSRVEVRRGSLRVLLDDKLVAAWQGDITRFSDSGLRDELPDPRRLGVITFQPAATFHKIVVREVTGHGQLAAGVTAVEPQTAQSAGSGAK